ncbi:hypothetical protein ACH433_22195 [Streptomyces olivaceoviridis]|uniref:hypothetical protein n=1 Tax=Streptomyces olivaceoviridis TaxID=1921 RepID=UPI0037B06DCD
MVGPGSPERIAGAPEELPLVAGVAGFDDATVVRRLGGRSRRSDTLGFGLGEAPRW